MAGELRHLDDASRRWPPSGSVFAYGFYTLAALASFFFVIFLVPETKGVELEDMEELQGPRGARRGANA